MMNQKRLSVRIDEILEKNLPDSVTATHRERVKVKILNAIQTELSEVFTKLLKHGEITLI